MSTQKKNVRDKSPALSAAEEKLKTDLKKYCQIALGNGASEARIVPASKIVQTVRARLGCFFPLCFSFGSCNWCPPNWETGFQVARAVMKSYKYAVFFRFFYKPEWYMGPLGGGRGRGGLMNHYMDHYEHWWKPDDVKYWRDYIEKHGPTDRPDPLSMGVPEAVEAEARKDGHHFAFYGAVGPCCNYLCGPEHKSRCIMLKSGVCRFPAKSRPEGAAALYYDYPRTLPDLGWQGLVCAWSVLPEDVKGKEMKEQPARTSFVLIE